MSGGGGGGGNLLNMGLMIAAGVAAPELAPELLDAEGGFMGLSGTSALTAAGAVTGAGLSGLAGAATGQNVLRSAALGGIGGGLSGYMEGANAAANAGIDPNVANQAAQQGTSALTAANAPTTGGTLGTITTPQEVSQAVANGQMTMDQAAQYGQAFGNSITNAYPNGLTAAQAGIATPMNATTGQMIAGAAPTALSGLSKKPVGAYVPPNAVDTGGSLSKFKYDPNNYSPDVVVPPRPPYQANYSGMAGAAEGGIMSLAGGGYAHGGKTYSLGDYSDGGRLLKGPGDGMSDDIPATIGHKQEARLADGEFVVPADVVSGLGNGSTDAGAKHLYKMMDKVRHARTGRKTQGKQIEAEKYVPA